jgi:hypothetical protein
MDLCLKEGWDINAIVDHEQKFNAASLAAHLDKLEVLHFLDLRGANISKAAGKFGNSPLMTGLMSWNVRIIDYLTERGVDPFVEDQFGFTALRKAKIKNFRTISSILTQYETRYKQAQFLRGKQTFLNNITSKEWEEKLKGVDITDYTPYKLWRRDNKTFGTFKPSDLLAVSEYPFSNFEDNQMVLAFATDMHFFRSGDDKLVL